MEEALQTSKFQSNKQKAALNILYTAWWLKTMISQELKEMGLTHEQYNVLRILKGSHPEHMCVKDIGSRMIERSSNVPRIVDKLVAKELAARTNSAVDKRETVISLTAGGMNVLRDASRVVEALFKKTVSITEEEARQLSLLLEQFRKKE